MESIMGLMAKLKCIHILIALVYSDIFYWSEIITILMYISKDNLLLSVHYYKLYC